ncbi:hypothetical protein OAO87_03040 [bacterium]|nr:hypothetical protein [bacterium]
MSSVSLTNVCRKAEASPAHGATCQPICPCQPDCGDAGGGVRAQRLAGTPGSTSKASESDDACMHMHAWSRPAGTHMVHIVLAAGRGVQLDQNRQR